MPAPIPAMFIDRYVGLSDEQRMKFDLRYQIEAKDPTIGLICALFGVFYFYMGDAKQTILMLLSSVVCIGIVWSIITLINATKLVEQHNTTVAHRLLTSM